MKVLTIFLAFLLWTETPRASVIKRNESSTEIENNSTDDSPQSAEERQGNSSLSKKAAQKLGEPFNEIEFYKAKFINSSTPKMTSYKGDSKLLIKAGLFEGDIAGINISDVKKSLGRNAILDSNYLWPDGLIPYTVAADFEIWARLAMARAILRYHYNTCIRFTPKTSAHTDYIHFMQGTPGMCSSQLGRVGGQQDVSLPEGCHNSGIITHEIMHALGYMHEQSREDRDDHVTIVWDNIQKDMQYNFEKYNWSIIQALGEPYDLNSIMHYEPYAFAVKTSEPTIIPKAKGSIMGQRLRFSESDVKKINRLYQCKESTLGEAILRRNCADDSKWCVEMARKGDCEKNSAWMKPNCMKACGLCGGGCKDHSSHCAEWSRKGECKANSDYMNIACKKTCKKCT